MNRNNWYAFAIIGVIIAGVAALIYLPGVHEIQTGQITSPPPAMDDSSAGGSTGQSGQALPTIPLAKQAPAAPAQAPAQ
jgi:hypothetical protein